MGGVTGVMDVGAACGVGGVQGTAWGAAEVMSATWGWPRSVKQAAKELRRARQSDRQPMFCRQLSYPVFIPK
jgi:hypothetical protein